jgi:hypothetical protein
MSGLSAAAPRQARCRCRDVMCVVPGLSFALSASVAKRASEKETWDLRSFILLDREKIRGISRRQIEISVSYGLCSAATPWITGIKISGDGSHSRPAVTARRQGLREAEIEKRDDDQGFFVSAWLKTVPVSALTSLGLCRSAVCCSWI